MADLRIEFDEQTIKDLLVSPELHADIQHRVDSVRDLANTSFNAHGFRGNVIQTDRWHGAVWAGDAHSRNSARKHNTLVKALDAGKVV